MKNNPLVCILTSGKGSRMGPLGKKLNKSLHPLGDKAIISHIIEKFPKSSKYVISLGFHGSQVKKYLELAHPDRSFKFVFIKNYYGKGSGPGQSLLECKNFLNKPFFYVACDTLWEQEIDFSLKNNWVGVSKVKSSETINYCNLKIENNLISDIKDKIKVSSKNHKAFIGLCFIENHKLFWKALKEKKITDGERQISNGLQGLIDFDTLKAIELNWDDVGTLEKYKKTQKKFSEYDFSKTDESLYILNNKVIKFFSDPKVSKNRVKKSKLNKKVFPKITDSDENFYAYDYVKGKNLYQHHSKKIFRNYLEWLKENLWLKKNIPEKKFSKSCKDFYQKKTIDRLKKFKEKYPNYKEKGTINGKKIPPIQVILDKLPWSELFIGYPVFMHGDLHFDNTIFDRKSKKFTLIDWRDEFSGHINLGDIYYDFAKLYGGLILNYDLIKENKFIYKESSKGVIFSYESRDFSKYVKIFEDFILSENFNLKKIRILVGLIYLNMSPLHTKPFDKLLFNLSREFLSREIN